MTEAVIQDLKRELDETIVAMRRDLSRVRTGRASVGLLDGLSIEYYGAQTPLNQVASLSAPEPRLLVIQPFDRSVLGDIERAIHQSDLGLTPSSDGKIIRVPIPEPTQERRKDMVKHVRKIAEDYRVSARTHRREAIDLLKTLQKDKEITEDDLRKAQEKVEELTKHCIDGLDHVLKTKEAEVMEV